MSLGQEEACRQQVYAWTKTAEFVESFVEFDEHGNELGAFIYQKDGKLYAIKSLNGETVIKNGKFCHEVTKHTKTVEQVIYCDTEGWRIAARVIDNASKNALK